MAQDERLLVERWLGRTLSVDETVRLNAYGAQPDNLAENRDLLRREIMKQALEISSRATDISEGDRDKLIEEAFSPVRARQR